MQASLGVIQWLCRWPDASASGSAFCEPEFVDGTNQCQTEVHGLQVAVLTCSS